MSNIKLRMAKGGYIFTDRNGQEEVFTSLDEVFKRLLLNFEGRASSFTGTSYGDVAVLRDPAGVENEWIEQAAELLGEIKEYVEQRYQDGAAAHIGQNDGTYKEIVRLLDLAHTLLPVQP